PAHRTSRSAGGRGRRTRRSGPVAQAAGLRGSEERASRDTGTRTRVAGIRSQPPARVQAPALGGILRRLAQNGDREVAEVQIAPTIWMTVARSKNMTVQRTGPEKFRAGHLRPPYSRPRRPAHSPGRVGTST